MSVLDKLSNIPIKLRLLPGAFPSWIGNWWTDVWLQDPDEGLCCDGRECGCMGATYRDQWEWALRKSKS